MGRITLFSADDLLSQQVKAALEKRGLPFTEISFNKIPAKYYTVRFLSSCVSVPQVFFNNRFVGGVKGTIDELQKWDKECSNDELCTMDFMYKEVIAKHPINNKVLQDDNADLVAAAGETEPVPENGGRRRSSRNSLNQAGNVGRRRSGIKDDALYSSCTIEFKDGSITTYCDVTERLKNSLQFIEEYAHKGTGYMDCCFTGKSAVDEFQKSLQLSEEDAIDFGTMLLNNNIIYDINDEEATTEKSRSFKFDNKEDSIFCLRCYGTPTVLNSYCTWPSTSSVNRPLRVIIEELDILLREIEDASISQEEDGKLDHHAVRSHELYPKFEEAICILQKVDVIGLDYNEMLSFSLNVFNLMIRYAFIKVGIPTTDSSRMKLFSTFQFNIGGELFTLRDWVDGILRGNKKTGYRKKPFTGDDPRKKWIVQGKDGSKDKVDPRIHFAINMGPHFGSSSTIPFDRYTPDDLDKQLDIVSAVYFEDDVNFRFDDNVDTFLISKAIIWYRCDFCNKENEFIASVQKYAQGTKLVEIKKTLRKHPKLKGKYIEIDLTRNIINYFKFSDENKGIKSLFRRSKKRFQPPRMPANELARLTTLHNLNVLDSAPNKRIDEITNIVRERFDVPLVFVSLLDEERQWFLSKQSKEKIELPSETGRDISFCGHTILGGEDDVMHIQDATEDDRFAENPLVAGDMHLRFYAGANLAVPDSYSKDYSINGPSNVNVGTLCILDHKPREFSDEEKALLKQYASEVRHEMLNNGGTGGKNLGVPASPMAAKTTPHTALNVAT